MSSANGHSADTCDNRWSGAGQVYVRRAIETVLSTSSARALWANTSGLESGCRKFDMQVGPQPGNTRRFTVVSSTDTWLQDSAGVDAQLSSLADANPGSVALGLLPRLNPMAAGTTISATGSVGIAARVAGGSPVPNSTEATTASVTVRLRRWCLRRDGIRNVHFAKRSWNHVAGECGREADPPRAIAPRPKYRHRPRRHARQWQVHGRASLARQLGLRFVDSDTEIERRIGMPIKDYFALHGEEAFRDQEQAVIDELTASPSCCWPRAVARCCGLPTATRCTRARTSSTCGPRQKNCTADCATTRTGPCCRWKTRCAGCETSIAIATRCTAARRTSWWSGAPVGTCPARHGADAA
jgi:hypothetical protein